MYAIGASRTCLGARENGGKRRRGVGCNEDKKKERGKKMAAGGEHKVFMNGFWKPEEIRRSIKSQKSRLTPKMGSPAQSTVDTRKV